MSDFADEARKPLPDGVTLKPDRRRWLLTFLICVGFVATVVWIGPEKNVVLFWLGGGFFAIGACISVPLMLGHGGSLVLDREGFVCNSLFKPFRREWRECSAFYPVRISYRKFVGFTTQQDEAAHPELAAFNRRKVGASGMLPDTYGLGAEKLCDLMNKYRARARGDQD